MKFIGLCLLALTLIPTLLFDVMHVIGTKGQMTMSRINYWIGTTFK